MLIDYHVHNRFSPDSHEDTRKIVQQALDKGIKEICITNHVEWHDSQTGKSYFDEKEATERFRRIKAEISLIQPDFPKVRIGFGAEVEYVADRMEKLTSWIKEMGFDFVLGSVHAIDNIVISSHKYADALYSKMSEKSAYEAYFHEMEKLVEWGQMDVIAHFDINKKYGCKFYGTFQPEKNADQIKQILKSMAKKRIGLELNTNCMKDKCHEVFPHPTILRWAVEAGIKNFTLGSDAHEKRHVGQHLGEALKIAKEAGITTVSTYLNRKPTLHAIDNA